MADIIENLTGNLFSLVSNKHKPTSCTLVKKHSEDLKKYGEFSIVNLPKPWFNYLDKIIESNIIDYLMKQNIDILEISKNWKLPIASINHDDRSIYIYLERPIAIKTSLSYIPSYIENITEKMKHKSETVTIDPLCAKANDLTALRTQCLVNVIQNLCSIHSKSLDVIVTSKSSSRNENKNTILCGAVLNAKTGEKETKISAEDYIRSRQNDMTLLAQHKYGVRVTTESKWREFINNLGESAAVFEMLEIKPSSTIKINFGCPSQGSSKGASFVLYNCARLETLIRTFYENVDQGVYPPLVEENDVDFTLLKDEDEWTLIFNYILSLPSLINSCVDINVLEFKPHLLCGSLLSMVRVFSQYYRRVRILTEARTHLIPVLMARIHMLVLLNKVLKLCLRILNIASVTKM